MSTSAIQNKTTSTKEKKTWMPHAYVIIFTLMVIAAILTWVIPAGQFNRIADPVTHRNIVQAGTFHTVAQQPVGLFEFFMDIQKGMVNASEIMVFIFVIGGTFGLFKATGAIDALIARMITIFSGKTYDRYVFVILTAFFFTCSAVFGMGEEAMVFVPFFVSMSIALGYDAILAAAIMIFSIALGYTGSLTNPFNVGLAQTIAGLPMYSGLWYRAIVFLTILSITCWYMLRYAKKIKKDPSKSLVADIDYSHVEIHEDPTKVIMTRKHKMVLLTFGGSFVVMIYAIMKWHFWLDQLTGIFIIIGLLVGIAARMPVNEIAEHFIEGAKTLLFAAILVGLSRGIQTVLEHGVILDAVINYIVQPLSLVPRSFVGPVMVFVQSLINLTIPSASAMAVVTMPIMTPLADVLGIQRQTACLAFQFGDGITNLILPTWDVLLIGIGLAGVPFQRWFKFVLPLVGVLFSVALVFVFVAELIKVGPF